MKNRLRNFGVMKNRLRKFGVMKNRLRKFGVSRKKVVLWIDERGGLDSPAPKTTLLCAILNARTLQSSEKIKMCTKILKIKKHTYNINVNFIKDEFYGG